MEYLSSKMQRRAPEERLTESVSVAWRTSPFSASVVAKAQLLDPVAQFWSVHHRLSAGLQVCASGSASEGAGSEKLRRFPRSGCSHIQLFITCRPLFRHLNWEKWFITRPDRRWPFRSRPRQC